MMMLIFQHIKKGSLLLMVILLAACSKEPDVGEQVVNTVCVTCHAQAINGAPIIGNKKMWSKRLPKGEEQLIQHAIEGFELMPAKGGRTTLSDEEVAAAVRYMIGRVQ